MKKIAIVCGGYSGEYEISISSAKVVKKHLDPKKYDTYIIVVQKDRWYHHLRHHRHGRGRVAVLEFLRLAERAQLHPAARGHHPHPPLLPEQGQGRDRAGRGLERRPRRHRRRRRREPRQVGLPRHQRHGRRRHHLGPRPADSEEEVIA